jgi:putative membrane protein
MSTSAQAGYGSRGHSMLRGLLFNWAILAVAIGLVAALMDSVDIDGGVLGTIWVAALFGLVNALIGPILRLLSLPLTIVTFGLFALVVNAALLGITAGISDYLSVGGLWTTTWAAFLISVFSAILGFAFRPRGVD